MSAALDSIKVRGTNGDVKMEGADDDDGDEATNGKARTAHELNLDSLAFREGSHTMTNKKMQPPHPIMACHETGLRGSTRPRLTQLGTPR
jgi:hypothetical protein